MASARESDGASSEGEGEWLGVDSERSADDDKYDSDFVVSDHSSSDMKRSKSGTLCPELFAEGS